MAEAVEPVPELGEVRAEEEFDRERLAAYLRGKIAGAEGPMEVHQFRGGHSNLTYLLRFGSQEWVMRRPPLGPLAPTAHDMNREYRVLSRVWQVFPPAPRAVLLCEDSSIIGAPFFVMERRRGILIKMRQPLPPELGNDPVTFRRLSEAFIDTLAALHMVDYEKIGLGDLGKPVGFVERQISGWIGRWERAKTQEIPLMNKLGAWFLANMPPTQPPALLHNDFYLHNMMFDSNDFGRVTGVFDWEMATIGDPMIDFGLALSYWRDPDDPEELLELSEGHAHTTMPGFLRRAQLAERYAKKTGRDISKLAFYRAWAYWRNATVVQQIYVRFVRGQTTDPRFERMGAHPPILARTAALVAAQLGFRE
jgi:aminoglycoside phosphotransferase (APT) family kinase protein